MSEKVAVTVSLEVGVTTFTASETGVNLTDDAVQVSAAGLAYGLVESAWGALVDDE